MWLFILAGRRTTQKRCYFLLYSSCHSDISATPALRHPNYSLPNNKTFNGRKRQERSVRWTRAFPVNVLESKHFQFVTAGNVIVSSEQRINRGLRKREILKSEDPCTCTAGGVRGGTTDKAWNEAIPPPSTSRFRYWVILLSHHFSVWCCRFSEIALFLASLPAAEQATLLLQKAGLNKRPGCISAVFNFLRSWERRCKSSWNLLLCPLRFS